MLRWSVPLLLAQQGWEPPMMALQSDQGSVWGRDALHILQCCPWDGCWKGARGSLAAFLSEWPPTLKTCPLHLWKVTGSLCQISVRKFKPKVCPNSRDSWGNIPRHVCLLPLGGPNFVAHLHCLSEKCKACSW